MIFNQSPQTIDAYQRYGWGLSSATLWHDWVYDPDFALAQDPDIYAKIIRDPVAAHAMRYRKALAAGLEWTIVPGGEQEEDKALAGIVEELMQGIYCFTDARVRLADAIFRGSTYEFIEGQREFISPGGSASGWWWQPKKLVNVDRRRFRIARDSERGIHWQFWSVERFTWEPLAHPEWFIHSVVEDTEDNLGYGGGLLSTIYTFQRAKAACLRDGMRTSERCGMGFLKAKVNNLRGGDGKPVASQGRDGDSVADAWIDQLQKMAAENVLVHDERDDVSLVTGWAEGFQIIKELIDYCDHSIVMTCLGAVVQTMEPKGGSFALAKEQSDSTESLVRIDRQRIGEDIDRDLVGAILRNNRAQIVRLGLQKAAKPTFQITHGKHQDPNMWSEVIGKLQAAGMKLRLEEVYKKTGFTRPVEGDEVLEPQTPPLLF